MTKKKKNLSEQEGSKVPSAKGMRIGIVYSEWNYEITGTLKKGAVDFLLKHGCKKEHIEVKSVPGSFELTLGAQWMIEHTKVDAVICLGCVIQGETRHFDFICDAVAHGITQLNIDFSLPVIFGVLTPNTMKQAQERAGGKHGNKGEEAAATAIKMLALKNSFTKK